MKSPNSTFMHFQCVIKQFTPLRISREIQETYICSCNCVKETQPHLSMVRLYYTQHHPTQAPTSRPSTSFIKDGVLLRKQAMTCVTNLAVNHGTSKAGHKISQICLPCAENNPSCSSSKPKASKVHSYSSTLCSGANIQRTFCG